MRPRLCCPRLRQPQLQSLEFGGQVREEGDAKEQQGKHSWASLQPPPRSGLSATPHLTISHSNRSFSSVPSLPSILERAPNPSSWKKSPCPSKAFSSPNIVFVSPSPPPFFILNKNIITGF